MLRDWRATPNFKFLIKKRVQVLPIIKMQKICSEASIFMVMVESKIEMHQQISKIKPCLPISFGQGRAVMDSKPRSRYFSSFSDSRKIFLSVCLCLCIAGLGRVLLSTFNLFYFITQLLQQLPSLAATLIQPTVADISDESGRIPPTNNKLFIGYLRRITNYSSDTSDE